ncbi:hypothetical protein CV093_14790 [Oceanobacillus sp. 143]|uniref:hypothetical protein n=1 Tax=Oceanobacillus zhaokaii TaxID=2052660 RepID=UPI00131646AB|nr:hypothetical protein [Oceanobacillus zhaokaii]QGS69149.1 hypothetical protein CV093_14790 [Oceanobacillus sp. 143]
MDWSYLEFIQEKVVSCNSVQVIFKARKYDGVLKQRGLESKEHRFFRKEDLPENLNPRQKQFILHWAEERIVPIIS